LSGNPIADIGKAEFYKKYLNSCFWIKIIL